DYAADGMDPAHMLTAIDKRVRELLAEQDRLLLDEVMPALAASGFEWVRYGQVTETERQHIEALFRTEIAPVLTPLAIDPGHPFPFVHNKSLNVALLVESAGSGQQLFAVVHVPAVLDRVVLLPRTEERVRFVLLEEVVAAHLGDLFGGFNVIAHTFFRVTRNGDLKIGQDGGEDPLPAIGSTLRQRHSE